MEKPDGQALSKGRVNRGSVFRTTPKASCASASGVRPEMGMFSICAKVITCPVEAEAVCRIGRVARTLMVSVCVATILTPAIAAFAKSLTRPLIVARNSCPERVWGGQHDKQDCEGQA